MPGFKRGLDKFLEEKAISPDGFVLTPVAEAVSLYTPVAGEHGWKGAVASVSYLWVPGQQLVGHCGNRVQDYTGSSV